MILFYSKLLLTAVLIGSCLQVSQGQNVKVQSASKGNVHYNKDGYGRIADRISEEILKLLSNK